MEATQKTRENGEKRSLSSTKNAAPPAKKYKHVIFDADDTLLRYRDDEKEAFRRLYKKFGIAADEKTLEFSNEASERTWTASGLYDVHAKEVQTRYHILYREHIELVFEEIFRYLKGRNESFTARLSAKEARDEFLKELETGGCLMNGAKKTLKELKGRGYTLSIATNGLAAIQKGRTAAFRGEIEHLFVSEELGAIKPTNEFFDKMLTLLQAKKEDCLFVGDSLTSDIKGAQDAGIDRCFFNPLGKILPENSPRPNFEIKALNELLTLL